jgi:hypothetical protein
MTAKAWSESEIKEMLDSNDKAVWRAVWRLFERQTEEEREIGATVKNNSKGFNAFDAPILSSFAKQYQKFGRLTQRQTDLARKKIRKYIKQLVEIANS